jgi:hypothetical protein
MADSTLLIPAAQYLRMSTEHQRYSLETSQPRSRRMHKPIVSRSFSPTARPAIVLLNCTSFASRSAGLVSIWCPVCRVP